MSRIVIVAVGSRGDVAPLAGLGVGLARAGHDVAVAAYSPFAAMITDCGLTFRELPAAVDIGADADPARGFADFAAPAGMRRLGSSILDAVADEPADMLLLSPFAEMAGHPLAEAKDIPALGVRLQPLSATSAHPPAVLGAWSAGARGNRLVADAGAWSVDRLYGGVVADLRRRLGLPRASTRTLRGARTRSDWTVLHGYSPVVASRPADWRAGLQITGYWWPPALPHWRPPAELTAFLAAGPPPAFVGLGSVMTSAARARELSAIFVRAAELAGVRMIVQSGWAALEATGADVLTIGEVPHEWLFPQVSAVAHHCGAGTVGAGLRAGAPAVALPGYGDGPFWARRLQKLGACSAIIPQRRLTAEKLAAALGGTTALRSRVADIAAEIGAEDGVGQAVSIIQKHLHRGDR